MEKEYDIDKLKELIASKDVKSIKAFMEENDLVLSDGIIESKHKADFNDKAKFYDLKQYITKIKSNSAYGCILNKASTFYRFELGASITLSGRKVWQHLASKSNEILTNEYNYEGECVQTGDTDSVRKCSILNIEKDNAKENISIENLYNCINNEEIINANQSYIKKCSNISIKCCDKNGNIEYKPINYIFKHRVKKRMYKIKYNNKEVCITEDHSLMVKRDNKIIGIKVSEMQKGDKIIIDE